DLPQAVEALGADGPAWRRLLEPFVREWPAFAAEVLGPVVHLPRSPLLLARFGVFALAPAQPLAKALFRTARTRALFAGLAAHSFLSLRSPLSAAVGIVLGASAHAVGWPIAQGGAQSITQALVSLLAQHGGSVHTSAPVLSLDPSSPGAERFVADAVTLCDLAPAGLLSLAGSRLPPAYRRTLSAYARGPAIVKIDYALSEPIPWRPPACRRASTVHLGGTLEQIAACEAAIAHGQVPAEPFVLLAQPTLADPTRAPAGRHIAWAYCHAPQGVPQAWPQIVAALEAQIERFAPGFRECVLARAVSTPQTLEASDQNLLGGDISGGAMTLGQTLLRPTWRGYQTPDPRLFLCSASTPPGAGVHGMCGFHAAHAALRSLRR
ncbi:MAG TPA: NAD(P)/FAD-dependent oxidoreductase, partial [Acidobacteriaceae bacterium]